MRRSQPIWAGVVEVGERALLQLLLAQAGRIESGVALRGTKFAALDKLCYTVIRSSAAIQ